MTPTTSVPGVSVVGIPIKSEYSSILDASTQSFLLMLHRTFEKRRQELLASRRTRQQQIDQGIWPTFLPNTRTIREDPKWMGAPLAPGMADRRVEITGPVDRKMIINALNSGATHFMADFEDSTAPTWENCMDGQVNLRDAIARNISFEGTGGKNYKLNDNVAVLIVRPRGWHLDEKHFIVDGSPISASLFDFGVYFFHNAKALIALNNGPYFYLPKLESHLEARLWNDVFNVAQEYVGLPRGTIRATVLVETILAAFEMEEIIYELREHSSGLNCGRWDYIFSVIKKFRNHKQFVLPDRSDVTMTVPFMQAYVSLLIKTCHKRGVHAMGGMAAQIPIKSDEKLNEVAMSKVRQDKLREVKAGHDGTWVAHPDLVKIAREIFDREMPPPNQIHLLNSHSPSITADGLLTMTVPGKISMEGIRGNVRVSLLYIESWLRGLGCVPIAFLMEDAATAEIARSQLWQWCKHGCKTADGIQITHDLVNGLIVEEAAKINNELGNAANKLSQAKTYLEQLVNSSEFIEFLTSLCYNDLIKLQVAKY